MSTKDGHTCASPKGEKGTSALEKERKASIGKKGKCISFMDAGTGSKEPIGRDGNVWGGGPAIGSPISSKKDICVRCQKERKKWS